VIIDGRYFCFTSAEPKLAREDVLLVPFTRERGDGVRREFARHLLDLELVVGEVELRH